MVCCSSGIRVVYLQSTSIFIWFTPGACDGYDTISSAHLTWSVKKLPSLYFMQHTNNCKILNGYLLCLTLNRLRQSDFPSAHSINKLHMLWMDVIAPFGVLFLAKCSCKTNIHSLLALFLVSTNSLYLALYLLNVSLLLAKGGHRHLSSARSVKWVLLPDS